MANGPPLTHIYQTADCGHAVCQVQRPPATIEAKVRQWQKVTAKAIKGEAMDIRTARLVVQGEGTRAERRTGIRKATQMAL